MSQRRVGVIMNGVTGRMGYRQHLVRSILAIREQGGVTLPDGETIYPEPILVGRSGQKLAALAKRHGLEDYTTDLDEALDRDDAEIYFDAQLTLCPAGGDPASRGRRQARLHRETDGGERVRRGGPGPGGEDRRRS